MLNKRRFRPKFSSFHKLNEGYDYLDYNDNDHKDRKKEGLLNNLMEKMEKTLDKFSVRSGNYHPVVPTVPKYHHQPGKRAPHSMMFSVFPAIVGLGALYFLTSTSTSTSPSVSVDVNSSSQTTTTTTTTSDKKDQNPPTA